MQAGGLGSFKSYTINHLKEAVSPGSRLSPAAKAKAKVSDIGRPQIYHLSMANCDPETAVDFSPNYSSWVLDNSPTANDLLDAIDADDPEAIKAALAKIKDPNFHNTDRKIDLTAFKQAQAEEEKAIMALVSANENSPEYETLKENCRKAKARREATRQANHKNNPVLMALNKGRDKALAVLLDEPKVNLYSSTYGSSDFNLFDRIIGSGRKELVEKCLAKGLLVDSLSIYSSAAPDWINFYQAPFPEILELLKAHNNTGLYAWAGRHNRRGKEHAEIIKPCLENASRKTEEEKARLEKSLYILLDTETKKQIFDDFTGNPLNYKIPTPKDYANKFLIEAFQKELSLALIKKIIDYMAVCNGDSASQKEEDKSVTKSPQYRTTVNKIYYSHLEGHPEADAIKAYIDEKLS